MILLSIHPEYVEKIVSKVKTFEFRKLTPKDFNLDPRIAIYSTRPMCRIVAYVEVSRILSGKRNVFSIIIVLLVISLLLSM